MLFRMKRLVALAAALLLAGCGGGGGGSTSTGTNPTNTGFIDPVVYSSAAGASLPSANELSSVTRATVTINGTSLAYTATTGHLTARRLGTDAPDASMFYVAYTLDGRDPATRPVTFFYNGGPGSSTVWLHLGSFGPRRLAASAPSQSVPTPFPLVDNAESILDISDLVFVDAVSTGFSQAIAPNTNQSFWGVDADAAVFRDFIRRYATVNNRNASPKFLFGESYGTTRSAVLAHLMETAGVRLNGVILLVLGAQLQQQLRPAGGGGELRGLLPVVRRHRRLPWPNESGAGARGDRRLHRADALPDIDAIRARRRVFLRDPRDPGARDAAAVHRRDRHPGGQLAGQPQHGAQQLSRHPAAGPVARPLRCAHGASGCRRSQTDISSTFISPSFGTGITSYLTATLLYTAPTLYTMGSNAINTWNFSHDGQNLPDAIPDLLAAMTLNPRLRVLAVSGYHDLATPFFQTERDLQRIGPQPEHHRAQLQRRAHDLPRRCLSRAPEGRPRAVLPAGHPAMRILLAALCALGFSAFAQDLFDPAIPPHIKRSESYVETRGPELRAQVERKLRNQFEAADKAKSGALTREQARAAGLGYVADNFEAIDRRKSGVVRFDDVKRYLGLE